MGRIAKREEALGLDPLVPPFHESREVIVRNLRRKVIDAKDPGELRSLYDVPAHGPKQQGNKCVATA